MENYIHLNPILAEVSEGHFVRTNLFAHPFYYSQNLIEDDIRRDRAKALLFLHTLIFDYKHIKNNNQIIPMPVKSGVGYLDMSTRGYLLNLGAMIWRRRYMQSHDNQDPINHPSAKSPGVDYVWVGSKDGFSGWHNLYVCYNFSGSTWVNRYRRFSDYINEGVNETLENDLLTMFSEFVSNEFQEVMKCCELYVKKGGYYPLTPALFQSLLSTITGKAISGEFNVDGDIFINLGRTGFDLTAFYNYQYDLLCGVEKVTDQSDNSEFRIGGFLCRQEDSLKLGAPHNYLIGFVDYNDILSDDEGGIDSYQPYLNLYYSEENKIQGIFREIFVKECLVSIIPYVVSTNGISKNVLKEYYRGYADAIKEKYEEVEGNKDEIDAEMAKDEMDLKCELYLTLKNIWDRWLCGYYNQSDQQGKEILSVQNFFRRNFVFIDSFYTNIYDTLKLNCNFLLQDFTGQGSNNTTKLGKTTVAHLGDVASHHKCMMFNFPDNVNFSGLDENGVVDEEKMFKYVNEMFLPVPAMQTKPEYANKFTIVYTHSANKLDTNNRNKFISDGFDIWSYSQDTDEAPTIFKSSIKGVGTTEDEQMALESRMAYNVPAFGVAYSRQDNSFWKKIDVSMDNFNVTEQTVKAMAYITEKGNSEKNNICFYGQDLYSVYQTYSYLVTIEMMGNAQIQPLMYFQLMNIPMFRGTYMIIKVEHHITPGNMITKFTGMKMSKVQVPFTESWFTYPKDEDYTTTLDRNLDESRDSIDILTATDGTMIDLADNNLSKAIKNHLSDVDDDKYCDIFAKNVYNEYTEGRVVIRGRLTEDMFTRISNSSQWRTNKLQTIAKKGNNWVSIPKDPSQPKVGDLLFGYHNNRHEGNFDHVSIYLGVHGGHRYVAEGVSVSGMDDEVNKNIQICSFEQSRMGRDSDVITYVSHCTEVEVEQTDAASNYRINLQNGEPTTYNTEFSVAEGEPNMKHFHISFDYNGGLLKTRRQGKRYNITAEGKYVEDPNGQYVVNNQPNATERQCLVNLTNYVLDPLYEKSQENGWGVLTVSSAYRNRATNELTGGSSSSQHMAGQAADIQFLPVNMNNRAHHLQLAQLILQMEENSNFDFDQMIVENIIVDKENKELFIYPRWIHISYVKGLSHTKKNGDGTRVMAQHPCLATCTTRGKQYYPLTDKLDQLKSHKIDALELDSTPTYTNGHYVITSSKNKRLDNLLVSAVGQEQHYTRTYHKKYPGIPFS